MKKVTGIGGVFFKCKDPNAVNDWYKKHLGFDTTEYGTSLNGGNSMTALRKGLHNGILLKKQRNSLSLHQRIL